MEIKVIVLVFLGDFFLGKFSIWFLVSRFWGSSFFVWNWELLLAIWDKEVWWFCNFFPYPYSYFWQVGHFPLKPFFFMSVEILPLLTPYTIHQLYNSINKLLSWIVVLNYPLYTHNMVSWMCWQIISQFLYLGAGDAHVQLGISIFKHIPLRFLCYFSLGCTSLFYP